MTEILNPPDMDSKVKEIFSAFKGAGDELIPILQKVQETFSYLPKPAMLQISKFTRVPQSQVYAVATFYAQFRFTPRGKNLIMACRGTACHVKGGPKVLDAIKEQIGVDEGGTTPDLEYTLETVACIGCCGLSPCIMVNKEVEANLTPKKVAALFAKR